MRALAHSFGGWLACALAGALVTYVYAVVRVEPLTHDATLSAWAWFWRSYGPFLRLGLLFGGAAGLLIVWFAPKALGARRST